ncbi:MAG: Txe/YoeB family addiction module toxin [Acetobacteraceae bacterium]|nr:Txe/YoeB family addiction module toxin [Acetobacteraceae bacterium]
MKVLFTRDGWDDYRYWVETDPATLVRLNALIEDAKRHPFTGLGKPEALKGDLKGWWSRRITGAHRLVYRASGQAEDQRLEIVACHYHYGE